MSRILGRTDAPRALLQSALLLSFLALPELARAAEGDHQPAAEPHIAVYVWTVIVFVATLFILKRAAWGPIMKALDEREGKIRDSLEAAERAVAESARVAQEHERVLAEARKEATGIVEEGKRDAEAVRDRIVKEARDSATQLTDRAKADIERAKDKAVHEIHQRAVELSVAITEKLIRKTLSPEDHKALIDETIQQYSNMN